MKFTFHRLGITPVATEETIDIISTEGKGFRDRFVVRKVRRMILKDTCEQFVPLVEARCPWSLETEKIFGLL